MKVFQQCGDTLTLTAPSGGVTSGTPVMIGSILVVPVADAAEGDSFGGRREGVFTGVAKAASEAWSEGSPLYWDDGNSDFTITAAAGLIPAGYAVAAAQSADTTGTVLLVASPVIAAATVAAVSTAAATDLTTTEALANQLKTTVNDILTKLKAAGLMA